MKKILIMLFLLSGVFSGYGQIKLPKALKQLPISASPSSTDIASAIKEALENGIKSGTDRLSAEGGFLNNPLVKIVFPPEAQKAEKTLRGLGLNDLCDKTILSLNRAAEQATKEALPVFVNALKQMSLSDAKNILLSKDNDAATEYFKKSTTSGLTEVFRPVIKDNLDKAGATKYWTELTTRYNKVPLVSKINPDLNEYVTERALQGLFLEVAKEETAIRNDPKFRGSKLLQDVFAYADKNKF